MAPAASNSPARLVVVASDADQARRLAAEFDANTEPRCVATVAQALMAMREDGCDAVIARHEPPRLDAIVLACALRGAGDETPVAILGVEEATAREAGGDVGSMDEKSNWAEGLREAIAARIERRAARFALVAEQQRLAREQAAVELLSGEQHELLAALREVAGPDVRRYLAADQPAPETPATRAA